MYSTEVSRGDRDSGIKRLFTKMLTFHWDFGLNMGNSFIEASCPTEGSAHSSGVVLPSLCTGTAIFSCLSKDKRTFVVLLSAILLMSLSCSFVTVPFPDGCLVLTMSSWSNGRTINCSAWADSWANSLLAMFVSGLTMLPSAIGISLASGVRDFTAVKDDSQLEGPAPSCSSSSCMKRWREPLDYNRQQQTITICKNHPTSVMSIEMGIRPASRRGYLEFELEINTLSINSTSTDRMITWPQWICPMVRMPAFKEFACYPHSQNLKALKSAPCQVDVFKPSSPAEAYNPLQEKRSRMKLHIEVRSLPTDQSRRRHGRNCSRNGQSNTAGESTLREGIKYTLSRTCRRWEGHLV